MRLTRKWKRLIAIITSAIGITVLLCWLVRIDSIFTFLYQAESAVLFPKPWRLFAFRQITEGDPVAKLLAKAPPTKVEQFGAFAQYTYSAKNSGKVFQVRAHHGQIIAAGPLGCFWGFNYFGQETPEFDAALREFRAAKKQKPHESKTQTQSEIFEPKPQC